MNIAVIGAGVVGICTAYELALDGHAVSVFERHAAVAEEASFACGGHLSASLSHPLAFPAWPQTSRLRALFTSSGIALQRGASLADLRWLGGWKAASKGYFERLASAQQLAAYSLHRQQALTTQAALVFEQSPGQLLLLRSERELQAYQARLAMHNAHAAAAKVLTPEEARKLEPALGAGLPLHAAIHFPHDAVGNCRQFAHTLKDKAMELGVVFHFATPVTAISESPTLQVHSSLGSQGFEHVVVCAAGGAAALLGSALRPAGLTRLWSYTLSAHIREPLNSPRSAVVDGPLAISRMGSRVRVSGSAELGGSRQRMAQASVRPLYRALQTHFPGAADFSRNMPLWKGASLFTRDALPLVGASARPKIWMNLAHGHNGWSMACGSARLLADLMRGRAGELDATPLHPGRFKL